MKKKNLFSKKFKALSYITLIITAFYFFAHLLTMFSVMFPSGENEISPFVLGIDMLTWLVYGIFVVISVIIQCLVITDKLSDEETLKDCFYLPTFLIILFGGFSFWGIYTLFEGCF